MGIEVNKEPVHVSDHAVLRYLERGMNISVETVRAHIRSVCHGPAALGARSVRAEGLKFQIVNNNVVTVEPDSTTPNATTRDRNQRLLQAKVR